MSYRIDHLILRMDVVQRDWKLAKTDGGRNNGRKHLVKTLWPAKERPAITPEWSFDPEDGLTPVLETGEGGIEIATFTEDAVQDRHKHLVSTEIYIVLRGTLKMLINDGEPVELSAGDEVIVLPGTIHEILRTSPNEKSNLLVRVHALNAQGDNDKFVQMQPGGTWSRWSDLSPDDRLNAYRKS